jgi:hypothetical protein
MRRMPLFLAASVLALAPFVGGSAMAATLFTAHGINGEDLGFAEEFPVDVNIVSPDGTEACVPGLEFGDIEGPVEVDQVGSFGVEISAADGTDCGGTLLVADQVNVSSVDTAIILAHLDASNSPVVRKYNLNATELGEDEVRISAIHAAVAPAVDIEIEDVATFSNVQNGQQTFPTTVEDGRYRVLVLDPESGDRLARRSVSLDPGEIGVGIAVGSAVNTTLEILRLIIDTTEEPMMMSVDAEEDTAEEAR